MSQGLIAGAIAGAIAGGVVTGSIHFFTWVFSRRLQRKSLQHGFYFEIENHHIVELPKDPGDEPNFALAIFQDTVYKNNLSMATALLDHEFVQALIFYYSKLTSALEYQNMLSTVNSDLKRYEESSQDYKNSDAGRMEISELLTRRDGIRGVIRLILATAQFGREHLLLELKRAFKEDPSKKSFIDVLPQHQEWFKKNQTERMPNADPHKHSD